MVTSFRLEGGAHLAFEVSLRLDGGFLFLLEILDAVLALGQFLAQVARLALALGQRGADPGQFGVHLLQFTMFGIIGKTEHRHQKGYGQRAGNHPRLSRHSIIRMNCRKTAKEAQDNYRSLRGRSRKAEFSSYPGQNSAFRDRPL